MHLWKMGRFTYYSESSIELRRWKILIDYNASRLLLSSLDEISTLKRKD